MTTDGPLRRSQAIAPFGVGSLVVNKDGVSLVVCGLDNWFRTEEHGRDGGRIDEDEYRVEEWRLGARLGVKEFRLPPDYRTSFARFAPSNEPNHNLTVPVLRFPQWHVCQRSSCGKMRKLPLETRKIPQCKDVNEGQCRGQMYQVPLVAICANGHLSDFPWKEWVHRSVEAQCDGTLSLHQKGTGGLGGIEIRCEACKQKRNLGEVTLLHTDGSTFLSKNLSAGSSEFVCSGDSPWLGIEQGCGCGRHLLGSLRSSSNIYYSDTRSSIFLPRQGQNAPPQLVELLSKQPLNSLIGLLKAAGLPVQPDPLRQQQRELLADYSDETIISALKFLDLQSGNQPEVSDEDDEVNFRRSEFSVLRSGINERDLRSIPQDLNHYAPTVRDVFQRVCLIETLRETRALCGFTRIFAENDLSLADRRRQLWKSNPPGNWLPAYVVRGEGIYFEISDAKLAEWCTEPVRNHLKKLQKRYAEVINKRRLREVELSPRFVLLHTLSHLLMRQLTFDCGYSTASLRERLYVSDDSQRPMGGVLIYTAAGDSEGTMGGLVRMGRAGFFEPIVRKAVDSARWCSADPVCLEIGSSSGQGPDNLNLAACHSCALLPETACEQFNRFLDRTLIIGSTEGNIKGFF